VEPKGLKQIVSIAEMVILCVDLAYAGIVTLFYLKAWNALNDWRKVECCRRAGDTGPARQMTVFIASSLIALLALAEKAVVYATSSDNPAVGLLVTIGFLVQIGLEWRYLELLQMGIVAKEKAEGMTTGAADIIIPGNPSFVCELKRRDHTKSTLDPEQAKYLEQAQAAGAFVCIALGADAAMEAFRDFLARR